jgi:hypothetical protein
LLHCSSTCHLSDIRLQVSRFQDNLATRPAHVHSQRAMLPRL